MSALPKKVLLGAMAINERLLDFQGVLCAHGMAHVADKVDAARKEVQVALSEEIALRKAGAVPYNHLEETSRRAKT